MSKQRVEVCISGGVGNQLFQYAVGLSVSKRLNAELVLDLSWFQNAKTSELRKLELHNFVLLDALQTQSSGARQQVMQLKKKLCGYKLIRDVNWNPDRIQTLQSSRHLLLNGYWQSERYFSDVETLLRSSIHQKRFNSSPAAETARSIASSKCVGLHVKWV